MSDNARYSVLDYIRRSQRTNGLVPSTRAIKEALNYRSQTTVMRHLRALATEGLVEKRGGKWTVPSVDLVDAVPLFGTIPAGVPVESVQCDESIPFDRTALGLPSTAPVFALRVKGSSMINAGIQDGDVVLLTTRPPRHGEIVAAYVDGESTLKRFLQMGRSQPILKAENPDFDDIRPTNQLMIQGVMVGLLRIGSGPTYTPYIK